jgi:hypothetical protein
MVDPWSWCPAIAATITTIIITITTITASIATIDAWARSDA